MRSSILFETVTNRPPTSTSTPAFTMPASFPFRARFGLADFLIEDHDRIWRVKSFIAFLRVRQVEFVQHLNGHVVCAEQSLCFQRIAHARIDPMHFRPGLRDDHRRGILLREPEIFVREFVGLIAQAARHDRAHLVEAFKRFAHLASRRRFDRFPILLDALALIVVPTECRVLPTNLVQLNRPDAGVSLDGKQRIRSLDRSVLPRVAGKNHPRIALASEPQQFEHLPSANLPRLVHDHDRASGQFTLEKKIRDR